VVRPRSCRVIYYFDTPALGRRHQSFGRVKGREEKNKELLKIFEGKIYEILGNDSKVDEHGLSLNMLVENYTYNTIRIKESC